MPHSTPERRQAPRKRRTLNVTREAAQSLAEQRVKAFLRRLDNAPFVGGSGPSGDRHRDMWRLGLTLARAFGSPSVFGHDEGACIGTENLMQSATDLAAANDLDLSREDCRLVGWRVWQQSRHWEVGVTGEKLDQLREWQRQNGVKSGLARREKNYRRDARLWWMRTLYGLSWRKLGKLYGLSHGAVRNAVLKFDPEAEPEILRDELGVWNHSFDWMAWEKNRGV